MRWIWECACCLCCSAEGKERERTRWRAGRRMQQRPEAAPHTRLLGREVCASSVRSAEVGPTRHLLCDSHLLEPGATGSGKPGLVGVLYGSCFQASPTCVLPGSPRNTLASATESMLFLSDTSQSKTSGGRHLLISGRPPFYHWLIYSFVRTFTELQLCVSTRDITREKG